MPVPTHPIHFVLWPLAVLIVLGVILFLLFKLGKSIKAKIRHKRMVKKFVELVGEQPALAPRSSRGLMVQVAINQLFGYFYQIRADLFSDENKLTHRYKEGRNLEDMIMAEIVADIRNYDAGQPAIQSIKDRISEAEEIVKHFGYTVPDEKVRVTPTRSMRV